MKCKLFQIIFACHLHLLKESTSSQCGFVEQIFGNSTSNIMFNIVLILLSGCMITLKNSEVLDYVFLRKVVYLIQSFKEVISSCLCLI